MSDRCGTAHVGYGCPDRHHDDAHATAIAQLRQPAYAPDTCTSPAGHSWRRYEGPAEPVEICAEQCGGIRWPGGEVTIRDLLRWAWRAGVRRVCQRQKSGWMTREYWSDQHQMVRVISIDYIVNVTVHRPGTHIEFYSQPGLAEFLGALKAIGWDTTTTTMRHRTYD